MFKGLINDVKAAAGSLVVKYAARASVGMPFIIAFGFATAQGIQGPSYFPHRFLIVL